MDIREEINSFEDLFRCSTPETKRILWQIKLAKKDKEVIKFLEEFFQIMEYTPTKQELNDFIQISIREYIEF